MRRFEERVEELVNFEAPDLWDLLRMEL